MLHSQTSFDFPDLIDEDFDPLYDDGSPYLEYEAGLHCRDHNRADQYE